MGWIGRLCLKIERKINNINLQKKFLFSYIFIITLIFVLGISLSYFNISKFYIQQVKDVSEDAFLQAKDSLESLVENNLYAAYIVQNSDEIQSIFTQEEKDLMSQYEDMRKIQKYIFNINAPLSIFRITIYVSDDLVYSNDNLYYSKISELDEYEVFQTFVESSDVYIWMPTEYITGNGSSNTVLVNSILRKIGDTTDPVGYQRVSIRNSTIATLVEDVKYVESGTVFLYDRLYNEVISPYENQATDELARSLAMDTVGYRDYCQWESVSVDGEKMQVRMEQIDNTEWVLVSVYPEYYLFNVVIRQYILWIIAAIVIGIMSIVMAYWLSANMTKRIQILNQHMSGMAFGKGLPIDDTDGKDEIANLIQSYNRTLKQLNQYTEDIVKKEKKLRDSELKLLQSQINPHFLYNTLDLIHWEALNHDVPQISDITQTLAQFYKLSLSQGEMMVSIRMELNHVINYIEIQNYRYKNNIMVDVHIPPQIMDYQITKITLQPLVENAILHGLRNRENLYGAEIVIDGWMDQDYIYLQITDNGIGIAEKELENILDKKDSDSSHGFGIHNIQERLQLQYGMDCGLHYESSKGIGTTVTVKIRAEIYSV